MINTTIYDAVVTALKLEDCESKERDVLVSEFMEVIVNKSLSDLVQDMDTKEIEEVQEWLSSHSPNDIVAVRERFGPKMEDFLAVFNMNLHEVIREIERSSK